MTHFEYDDIKCILVSLAALPLDRQDGEMARLIATKSNKAPFIVFGQTLPVWVKGEAKGVAGLQSRGLVE